MDGAVMNEVERIRAKHDARTRKIVCDFLDGVLVYDSPQPIGAALLDAYEDVERELSEIPEDMDAIRLLEDAHPEHTFWRHVESQARAFRRVKP